MTSPLIRIALAAGLALASLPALAQTSLSNAEILKSLQGFTDAGPAITADYLRAQVKQHMAANPATDTNRTELAVQLDRLPQINAQIQFRLNSAIIEPSSYATLGAIADALHDPVLIGYKFVIAGSTDATGTRELNLKLSEQRAEAVLKALSTTFNISPTRLEAVGFGEEVLEDAKHPDSPVNRRVQIFTIGRTSQK